MRRFVLAALAGVAVLAAAPAQAATHDFEVKVLSSPAEMVTGDDALVQVSIPRNVPLHKATVSVNGVDITGTLELDAAERTLTGWSPVSSSARTSCMSTPTGRARGDRPPT